jgi:hypothetical protein
VAERAHGEAATRLASPRGKRKYERTAEATQKGEFAIGWLIGRQDILT